MQEDQKWQNSIQQDFVNEQHIRKLQNKYNQQNLASTLKRQHDNKLLQSLSLVTKEEIKLLSPTLKKLNLIRDVNEAVNKYTWILLISNNRTEKTDFELIKLMR